MISAAQFRLLALGAAFAVGLGAAAEARPRAEGPRHGGTHATSGGRHGVLGARSVAYFGASQFGGGHFGGRQAGRSYAAQSGHSGGRLQCVTFARADSGIELSGNADNWWYNAAGVYQRGTRPEAGSVLNFRANGSMHMGHVAVVNQVVDSRTIEIDHANWGGPGAVRGGISRDISVVDVSPANDWTAVRVALGHSAEFGSIYPTYGFIYNRPDRGTMVASNTEASPMPVMNPAPRDLRGAVRDVSYDEVAEAPGDAEPTFSRGHSRAGRHGHRLVLASYGHSSGRSFEARGFEARGSSARSQLVSAHGRAVTHPATHGSHRRHA